MGTGFLWYLDVVPGYLGSVPGYLIGVPGYITLSPVTCSGPGNLGLITEYLVGGPEHLIRVLGSYVGLWGAS